MVKTHTFDEAVFQVGSAGTGSTVRELRCVLPQTGESVVINKVDLLADFEDADKSAKALNLLIEQADACAKVDNLLGGKLSTWLLAEGKIPS